MRWSPEHIVLSEEGGDVTPAGKRFLTQFGVDADAKAGSRRIFCRPCLDWSERRYHVAGLVGAEICRCCQERGWLMRQRGHARAAADAGRPARLARELRCKIDLTPRPRKDHSHDRKIRSAVRYRARSTDGICRARLGAKRSRARLPRHRVQAVRRPHPQLRSNDAGVVGLRPGQVVARRRSRRPRSPTPSRRTASAPRSTRWSGSTAPCRSAGAFRREGHHHGRDPAQADDPAADRARRHAVSRQGPNHAFSVADLKAWEKKHGRVPQGAFVALRTDMSKDWDSEPRALQAQRRSRPGRSRPSSSSTSSAASPPPATRRWTPTPPTRWSRRPTFCSTGTIRSR